MLTIILILMTIAVAGGITWWREEGPEHFYEPEPFAPVNPPHASHEGSTVSIKL